MLSSKCFRQSKQLNRIPVIIHRVWKSDYVDLNRKKNRGAKRRKVDDNDENEDDIFFKSDEILYPINLLKIRENANSYTSLDEFHIDVQWFVHNCKISFGGEFSLVSVNKFEIIMHLITFEFDEIEMFIFSFFSIFE